MIRINLLPFRAARKKENIRRQISISILSVIFLFCGLADVFISLNNELASLNDERNNKKNELATYAKTIKRIEKIKKRTKNIQSKLDVMKGLEKQKIGPVQLLDEISMSVPKGKLWLESLREKKGILVLKGTANNNDTLAMFMTNLEKTQQIAAVDLKSAVSKELTEGEDKDNIINVTSFSLDCKLSSYQSKKKKGAKSRVKKGRR